MVKKSTVYAIAFLAFLAFAFTVPSSSQEVKDVKSFLMSDLVQVKGGKFVMEEYRVCQIVRPAAMGGGATLPIRVKRHVEAPSKGVISRDNFIRITDELLSGVGISVVEQMMEGITASQAMQALQCGQVFQPISNVDYEVNLIMDANGMNLSIDEKGTGEKMQQSVPWDQLFGSAGQQPQKK